MHKRKSHLFILIILGLTLISVQCNVMPFDVPSRDPDQANTESPQDTPKPPVDQDDSGEAPEASADNGSSGGWLDFADQKLLLLILALLFIAALLLLVLQLRRPRQEREATLHPQETTPLVEADTEEETLEIKQAPHLTLVADGDIQFSFPLERDNLTIGRASDNDLVIDEHFPSYETVSRTHARLYRRAGHWIIEDLNSKNGVYINQQRTGRNLLHEGWNVSLGGVTFEFHTHKAEVAA
jgi:hypothetical protein